MVRKGWPNRVTGRIADYTMDTTACSGRAPRSPWMHGHDWRHWMASTDNSLSWLAMTSPERWLDGPIGRLIRRWRKRGYEYIDRGCRNPQRSQARYQFGARGLGRNPDYHPVNPLIDIREDHRY